MNIKPLTLLACIILLALGSHAQDTTNQQQNPVAPAVTNNVPQRVANISDSLHQLADSLHQLKTALTYSDFFDSSAVAQLEKDATPIYTKPQCNKWVYRLCGWALFIVTMVGGLLLFAFSSICRDESYDENGVLRPYKERPYSYSRVHLFWWTMIILGCYIAFLALYGHLVPLNMTTVVMLGLGAAVLAGGKIIDERQKNNTPLGQRSQDHNAKCDSFFKDILSDDNGVSIHRFQTIVFNLAFGIGFISFFVTAVCVHQYPFIDFNSWQFALLGISSATYLGIKATENNTPQQNNSQNNSEQEAQRNINQ